MTWTKHLFTTTMLAGGLALGATALAVAQKPTQTPKVARPAPHPTATEKPSAPKPEDHNAPGVAAKLNMTSAALEGAYQTAKTANPNLTWGQFVAAHMVAHNLGDKNPAITTQAILDGLKGGKSIGQTLQGLGLSAKDAEDAEQQAERDAKAPPAPPQEKKPTTP